MIAYNILRIIGQESLKKKDAPGRKKIHRRRIRTVISNLMQFAGHLTEHAGRLVLSIGRSNRWRFTFKRLYDSFAFITWQQVAEYGNGSCTQMVQSVFERKIMQHFQNLVYNNKYGKHFLCAFSFWNKVHGFRLRILSDYDLALKIYINNKHNVECEIVKISDGEMINSVNMFYGYSIEDKTLYLYCEGNIVTIDLNKTVSQKN